MNNTQDNQEKIYNQYHDKIVRFFRFNLNDNDKAEDFASEVFIKIYDNLEKYDETKSNLNTWIYSICNNFLFDYYRKNNITLEYIEDIYSEECDEDIYLEDNLEILSKALDSLKPNEKSVIVMHYYENISLKEIAVKLGISYIYAKVLHANALNKMKKYF